MLILFLDQIFKNEPKVSGNLEITAIKVKDLNHKEGAETSKSIETNFFELRLITFLFSFCIF